MKQNNRQPFWGNELGIYAFLARKNIPKSYLGKIMLVAFFGTHIPLLSLFFYAISATQLESDIKIRILLVALVATLVGTALTLFALQRLLVPIALTVRGLRQYLTAQEIPQLPTQFSDEAGVLMADTVYAIAKLDESIQQLKDYDGLTSLPNRSLFQSRLQQAITEADRKQSFLAVMLLDLDDFATVNNSYGHQKGDWILRQTAQRLSSFIREGDLLSRVGSDEFALLHPEIKSVEDLSIYSQQMLGVFSKPFAVDSNKVYLGASVGIAVYPTELQNAEELINQADTALQSAKQEGRNTCQFYSPEMNEKLRRRLELERDLRKALEREELELFYQPQMELQSGTFKGAEALIRWRHPQHGFISPGEFIPIAESSGLILPIGSWVIETAARQNKVWLEDGFPELRVAVNLSAKQFQESDLIAQIAKILETTKLPSQGLELEITESLLMEDVKSAIATLQELRGLGLALALDDFGTGYSSLSYLKQFPLDFLKIDQSFVRGIPGDDNDTAIVDSIIALARSLRMDVIAEGVETEDQMNFLRERGCYYLQGYYFSRPLPAVEFTRLWEQKLKS